MRRIGGLAIRLRSSYRQNADRLRAGDLPCRQSELRSVDPHVMHDRRQLARHVHNGAFVATLCRQPNAEACSVLCFLDRVIIALAAS